MLPGRHALEHNTHRGLDGVLIPHQGYLDIRMLFQRRNTALDQESGRIISPHCIDGYSCHPECHIGFGLRFRGLYDLAVTVVAAVRADTMRHHRLAAVRASGHSRSSDLPMGSAKTFFRF